MAITNIYKVKFTGSLMGILCTRATSLLHCVKWKILSQTFLDRMSPHGEATEREILVKSYFFIVNVKVNPFPS